MGGWEGQGLTRKKLWEGWLRKYGPRVAWGPMVGIRAGNARLGGLRAPEWKWERCNRDYAPRGGRGGTRRS